MTTTTALTIEQQQRVEAAKAARAVLGTTDAGGLMTRPKSEPPAIITDLLDVADWMLTGIRLEVLDEHPTHVAVHNIGAGSYVEVSRLADDRTTFQQTTTTFDVPAEDAETSGVSVPGQRASEQDQPLMHHHVDEQEFTACGEVWATVARSTDDQSAVTCERCILALSAPPTPEQG